MRRGTWWLLGGRLAGDVGLDGGGGFCGAFGGWGGLGGLRRSCWRRPAVIVLASGWGMASGWADGVDCCSARLGLLIIAFVGCEANRVSFLLYCLLSVLCVSVSLDYMSVVLSVLSVSVLVSVSIISHPLRWPLTFA